MEERVRANNDLSPIEDEQEEEVLKAPDSQEEQQRIRAIKRDLKLFYDGQDLDITSDCQDIDTPTKELQELPVDCEKADSPQGSTDQPEGPKSKQKAKEGSQDFESTTLTKKPQELPVSCKQTDQKDPKTKQKKESSEVPAAGLKTRNVMEFSVM